MIGVCVQADLVSTIGESAAMGTAGVVIWERSETKTEVGNKTSVTPMERSSFVTRGDVFSSLKLFTMCFHTRASGLLARGNVKNWRSS